MMQSGRRCLVRIPGVREVFAGEAVEHDVGYRYCWRIRFVSEAVIDSYRQHPEHVAFADGHFRPFADDRISIDFQEAQAISGHDSGQTFSPPLNKAARRVQGSS